MVTIVDFLLNLGQSEQTDLVLLEFLVPIESDITHVHLSLVGSLVCLSTVPHEGWEILRFLIDVKGVGTKEQESYFLAEVECQSAMCADVRIIVVVLLIQERVRIAYLTCRRIACVTAVWIGTCWECRVQTRSRIEQALDVGQ